MQRLIPELKSTLPLSCKIEDIVRGSLILDDNESYELHRQLSDQQPDSAMLSMALGVLDVVGGLASRTTDFPSLPLLKIKAERLIDAYGPLWLRNAIGADIDGESALCLLTHLPEDLENFAELLALCKKSLATARPIDATLLEVFAKQAPAHALIAREYIEVLSSGYAYTETDAADASLDNVIPFPGAEDSRARA